MRKLMKVLAGAAVGLVLGVTMTANVGAVGEISYLPTPDPDKITQEDYDKTINQGNGSGNNNSSNGGSSSGNNSSSGGSSSSNNSSSGGSSSGGSSNSSTSSGGSNSGGQKEGTTDRQPPSTTILKSDMCVGQILLLVVDILVYGLGVAATLGVIIAGIMYMTARDSEAQVATAKKRLYEIVIGLVAWAVMFGVLNWLIPGGLNFDHNSICDDIGRASLTRDDDTEVADRL